MPIPSRYILVGLSVAGGVLSGLAWTAWCPGLILLVSLVPFLLIENHLFANRNQYTPNAYFVFLLPGVFIFSLITLGWLRVATLAGAVTVILGMSFLMAFTLWLAHLVRVKAGNTAGLLAFVSFWLAFEYATLNINFITPWANLGSGLAKDIMFIQWYEITGTGGGTLWILISNLLLAMAIESYRSGSNAFRKLLVAWCLIIILPSLASITRYFTIVPSDGEATEVVIIQPNADPYSEKFDIPFDLQLDRITASASGFATEETDWVIFPETIVDDPVNLAFSDENIYIRLLRRISLKFPGSSVVAGLVTYTIYPPSENPPTRSARPFEDTDSYCDYFNSAIRIDSGITIEAYHKSKLVPGIEMQFSNSLGKLATRILPYLGGTRWGYGIQEERTLLSHHILDQRAAPVICYESVFGNYVAEYVRNGANSIFIITNDGWWKNTDGYRQHLSYASLRAIETRRPVARSANTGVSCIIDIRGKIENELGWWTPGVIRGNIMPETRITPYVRYGDYVFVLATGLSALLLLVAFVIIPLKRR